MKWQQCTVEDENDIFTELASTRTGLSSIEAERRLREQTSNLPKRQPLVWWLLLRERFKSSFLYLLLAASALSFVLGDHFEAGLILVFIVINLALEMFQEYRSAQAVKLLKKYLVTYVQVYRDGKLEKVQSEDIVVGDVLVIGAGDRLPADIRFLHSTGLMVDESVMTGESQTIEKTSKSLTVPATEMYEAKNIGFAGTVVMSGCGEGIVLAVGKETSFGDIAALTQETERETVFEKGIRQFSRFILRLVFFTIALVYIANVLIRGGQADVVELLIFSLALAVSVVPEALPVIMTVALSRGALKLAQKKVVVKRLSAIEDLGSIEVLCCDKTGTLTENLLSVASVKASQKRQCLQQAFLACMGNIQHRGTLHDAFDLALWQALTPAERTSVQTKKRLDSIPFDPERRRNSVLVETTTGREVLVRGAPEEMLPLLAGLDGFTRKQLLEWTREAGRKGERVLLVAAKNLPLNKSYSLYEEQHLSLVGLISFADTLKSTARATIAKARELQVAVKIITGDSREVAGAVGYAVGLLQSPEQVVTGKELDEMDISKRREAIFKHIVFARVSPRQKYEIIKTLQEKHEVGFLGEGINDAPALKLANVAIVVESASDISREAADVVLLQKNLGTVIEGIREGRLIFANILKYLRITLTSNFGNFYSVALASLFLPFVPLLPIQILLLNLLSDFPMIAIATDTVDKEELDTPKNYHVSSIVLMTTLLGVVSSLFDFMLFGALYRVSPETLQTAWFILSLATEVILIYSLRTYLPFYKAKQSSLLLRVLSFVILSVGCALPFLPGVSELLHFIVPGQRLMVFILALLVGYFFTTEAVKRLYYRHMNGTLTTKQRKHIHTWSV